MEQEVVARTEAWIRKVVVGCNFCPFAAKPLLRQQISYWVQESATIESALLQVIEICAQMDRDEDLETAFLIFPDAFSDFETYLELADKAEELLAVQGYEGVYQAATFHPDYRFEGTDEQDPANYTNRSVYPMLHLLREDSVAAALDSYPDPEDIPERNIAFAREKGLMYMQQLRASAAQGDLSTLF